MIPGKGRLEFAIDWKGFPTIGHSIEHNHAYLTISTKIICKFIAVYCSTSSQLNAYEYATLDSAACLPD